MTPKSQSDDQFISIGVYTSSDAERLLNALERARIEFQIDCDDGIRSGSLQQSYGQRARIHVFVRRQKVTEVAEIQSHLLGSGT
jgi:hypothetical protein